MSYFSVFIISLVSLSYEVLLTRFFSISQWNHLSFMVISIALFGFSASGSVISLLEHRKPGSVVKLSAGKGRESLLILFACSVIGSFLVLNTIPLDYFRMPLERSQAFFLLLTFVVLCLPFFFAGTMIALAFTARPEKTGWIYFSSMTGSACGALIPIPLIPLLGEGKIIILSGILVLLFSLFSSLAGSLSGAEKKGHIRFSASAILAVSAFILLIKGGGLLEVKPSPYKLLAQSLQFPDTRISGSMNTLKGRLDYLESPYIRFAPGLSLKFQDTLPSGYLIIQDADNLTVVYDLVNPEKLEFVRFSHAYAGYHIRNRGENKDVLVIQRGGGIGVASALHSGARSVTLLVEHAGIAEYIVSKSIPALKVSAVPARSHLAGEKAMYDLIQIENWGSSIPASASLNQEHLFTVESFFEYLDHLKPQGILSFSRKIHLPPSDTLRLFSTAFKALKAKGVYRPDKHIFILRNWDSCTVLISLNPFSSADLVMIKDFCRDLNFDPVFHAGMKKEEANRFNICDEPYYYEALMSQNHALLDEKNSDFMKKYILDVEPATDDRPFFNRFTKWLKIGELYRITGSRFYSLMMSGEIVILTVLITAILVGIILLIIPLKLLSGRSSESRLRAVPYFLFTGTGFMFTEMFFIQEYTLLFGEPVVAFTVVLSSMLIFSGLGGAVSARWMRGSLKYVLIVLIIVLSALMFLIKPILTFLLKSPEEMRIFLSVGLLFPVSFMLGIPFPVGLRVLLGRTESRAYAWAANGIVSVIASILAVPIAMACGITRVLLAALISYIIVFAFLMSYLISIKKP